MKKQILLLMLMLLPMMASAQKIVKIDNIYYKLSSETKEAELINRYPFSSYKGDVVIPPTIVYEDAEYRVTSIGDEAFKKCTELTSVTIPTSVTNIGSSIFSDCTSLASIVVEEGNPKYDSRENCNAIIETASNKLLSGCQNTNIPNSVTIIGYASFSGCTGLTSVTIPDGVTNIGENAFIGCSGLTSVVVGCGVTSIGKYAFSGCNHLASINIPNGVTYLGEKAFESCSNLKKVELNNNAIVSKDYNSNPYITDIFGSQVEEYVLGEDVKSIGEYAFSNCPNLTTVHMSNGLTSIGVSAFYFCTKLTEINISSSVTSIDRTSFNYCGLKKVEINSNAIVSKDYREGFSLASYFGSQVEEYALGEEVTSIGSYAFSGCAKIPTINIPNGVTSIGDRAFQNCQSLTSINIPNMVTSIGEYAFFNCNGLHSIEVERGNTVYDSRDNCNALIKTADNVIILGCQNTVIPNSVTSIGNIAFYGCEDLTSISIPNSVTSIGDSAFYVCKGLTYLSIPTSVTNIGNSAFCGCTGLTNINIPNSVTTFGQYAFASCHSLTSVTIPNSVTTLEDYVFAFCYGLASITIPNSVTSIEDRAFYGCYGLLSIEVESGNTVYDSRDNCNALINTASNTLIQGCQNTVIPNSVKVIGDNAFFKCLGLASITIPNSVMSIGDGAFADCSNLTSVYIPNNVTSIGRYAFSGCSNLATVVVPNTVTTIGDYAFSPSGLKDMYCYAEQLPVIGNGIFQNTYYKETLHVPSGSIDAYSDAEQWKEFPNIVALPTQDDYRKMVKDGKVWKTGIYGSGNPVQHVEHFYFDGDIIIDGKTCKQMMCQQYFGSDYSGDAYPSLSYVGAWYEEDKKVYTYDTTNKQFVLMYDFSVDANDTLLINQDYYLIGPKQTGGLRGFKGVYRDVWFLAEEGPIYSPSWLEGVGSIDGPTTNVYPGYVDPLRFLMSCTDDDEVIYFNDEYEDGTIPEEMNANKHRFDFTHTVKTQPKAPSMSEDLQSLYGEYNQKQLSIHLDPLNETYVVCITNESNEIVYEKTVNTVDIVGLNIDISTYPIGRYTATVENGNESFVGEFEVQTTGIETIINKKEDARTYIYNLQGQRIRFLQKGLNIVNGRKVYVK